MLELDALSMRLMFGLLKWKTKVWTNAENSGKMYQNTILMFHKTGAPGASEASVNGELLVMLFCIFCALANFDGTWWFLSIVRSGWHEKNRRQPACVPRLSVGQRRVLSPRR
jgi:hypothetical protein